MTKPRRITYFKTILQDRPGALLSVMKDLKSKNIGLLGLWGFGTETGRGDLYVIPKNPERLRNAWMTSSILLGEGSGFFFKGTDKRGVLVKYLEALAQVSANITAINAVSVGGHYGSFVWVPEGEIEKASQALGVK